MQVRNSMWRSFRRRNKNLVNSTLSVQTDVMGSIRLPFSVVLRQPSVFMGGEVDLLIDFGDVPIGASMNAFIQLKNPSSRFPLSFKFAIQDLPEFPFVIADYWYNPEVPLVVHPLESVSIPVTFTAAEVCKVGCDGIVYVLNNFTRVQKILYRGVSTVPSMRILDGNPTKASRLYRK